MKVAIKDLPTQDLESILRYAKTMATAKGLKDYSIRITNENLIIYGKDNSRAIQDGEVRTGIETAKEGA